MTKNPNFVFLEENLPVTRLLALQGGTRSGKTYSTCQFLIKLAFKYSGLIISVARKTSPALRATVYRDFKEILLNAGLYDERRENKTEGIYNLNNNLIEFFAVDQPQKVRGRKRHILFCNEANELTLEDWRQLMFRTSGRAIIDYNPSMAPDHWIYNHVLPRTDCKKLITTYKDNPHLTPEQVAEIERLANEDPEYFKIYGQGQPGQIRGLVFPRWETYSGEPEVDEMYFGLDFGFSPDPTALTLVGIKGENLFCREIIYAPGLTGAELASEMQGRNLKKIPIYCDNARADLIAELRAAGFDARAAKKGADSVQYGIDLVNRYKIHIHEDSLNGQKEARNYKYKVDASGNTLGVPVDAFNHFWDSVRYVLRMVAPDLGKFGIRKIGR